MGDNVTEKSLTSRQIRAITALTLGSGSIAEAARAAHVARKTVHAWLREPVFSAELRRLHAEALQDTARRLAALGEKASEALERGLDPEQPISVQLRAAQLVLDNAQPWLEQTEVIARLEELERERNEQS
jgi:hypothetical protein